MSPFARVLILLALPHFLFGLTNGLAAEHRSCLLSVLRSRQETLSIPEAEQLALEAQKLPSKHPVRQQIEARLIRSQLRYVERQALRWWRPSLRIDLFELIQEGNLGTLRAIQKFDPKKGRFVGYARKWNQANIRNALLSHLRKQGYPSSRIQRIYYFRRWYLRNLLAQKGLKGTPENISEILNQVMRKRRLELDAPRKFTPEELEARLAKMGWVATPEQIHEAEEFFYAYHDHASLNTDGKQTRFRKGLEKKDEINWDEALQIKVTPESLLESASNHDIAAKIMDGFVATLDPKQKDVFQHLVLDPTTGASPAMLAQKYGITRQAIEKQRSKINVQLRQYLEKQFPDGELPF